VPLSCEALQSYIYVSKGAIRTIRYTLDQHLAHAFRLDLFLVIWHAEAEAEFPGRAHQRAAAGRASLPYPHGAATLRHPASRGCLPCISNSNNPSGAFQPASSFSSRLHQHASCSCVIVIARLVLYISYAYRPSRCISQ
jgi:hypothetical protein